MQSRGFPPIARKDARILILGSLPGQESLRQQQYYAYKHNAFWRIMAAVLGSSADMPYKERAQILIQNHIALWDVCAAAFRPGSLDSDIADEVPNDFGAFLRKHPHIRLICHNGGTSATLYARKVLPRLPAKHRAIPRVQLPSTSPAHAGRSFEQKLALWKKVLAATLNQRT